MKLINVFKFSIKGDLLRISLGILFIFIRKCGLVICNGCSSKRVSLPAQSSKPLRVCNSCFDELSRSSNNTDFHSRGNSPFTPVFPEARTYQYWSVFILSPLSNRIQNKINKISVLDPIPNTLNLDPDPECWPNLDPDPGLFDKFWKKKFKIILEKGNFLF